MYWYEAILFILWCSATNHYIRGVDETISYGWPQWVTNILGKHTWAAMTGGLMYLLVAPDWQSGLIVGLGLSLWALPGANFDVISQSDGDSRLENTLEATKRGLYIVPLFLGLWYHTGFGWLPIIACLLSVVLHGIIPLVISYFYNARATWAVGLHETLIGLCLGLSISFAMGAIL